MILFSELRLSLPSLETWLAWVAFAYLETSWELVVRKGGSHHHPRHPSPLSAEFPRSTAKLQEFFPALFRNLPIFRISKNESFYFKRKKVLQHIRMQFIRNNKVLKLFSFFSIICTKRTSSIRTVHNVRFSRSLILRFTSARNREKYAKCTLVRFNRARRKCNL